MVKFILSFFIIIPVILAAMSVWRSPLSASRAPLRPARRFQR